LGTARCGHRGHPTARCSSAGYRTIGVIGGCSPY
jgi:hypothetical protein